MTNQGIIIGLVGAPAIGKGFITQNLRNRFANLEPLWKITTREPRKTDFQEGVITVSQEEFSSLEPNLLAVHTPFENGNRYGWFTGNVSRGLNQGISYIADPNVEFLDKFRKTFTDSIHLIGLAADPEYLARNLHLRNGHENGNVMDDKTRKDSEMRLAAGINYSRRVIQAFQEGKIHTLLELDEGKRGIVPDLVLQSLPEGIVLNGNESKEPGIIPNCESYLASYLPGTERTR